MCYTTKKKGTILPDAKVRLISFLHHILNFYTPCRSTEGFSCLFLVVTFRFYSHFPSIQLKCQPGALHLLALKETS